MLTRRSFLGAALAAPAIVRAESLMKIWVPPAREVWVGPPIEWNVGMARAVWGVWPPGGILEIHGTPAAQAARNREMRARLQAAARVLDANDVPVRGRHLYDPLTGAMLPWGLEG